LLAGGHLGHADRGTPGTYKRPSVLSPGLISVDRNRELDGYQIRGGQFAALAHNVVADHLPSLRGPARTPSNFSKKH